MRTWTLVTGYWDAEKKQYVMDESRSECFDYTGPVATCKESASEKKLRETQVQMNQKYLSDIYPWQQQMAEKEAARWDRQSAMEEKYMTEYLGMSKQQYAEMRDMMLQDRARQEAWMAPIKASMSPYLTGDVGYGDSTLRLMQDQLMSDVATGYGDASSELKAALLARGGGLDLPVGGDWTRSMADLEMGRANTIAGGRRQISLADAEAALRNRFNAAGVMAGGGAMYGGQAGGFAGQSGMALGGFGSGASGFAQNPVYNSPGAPQALSMLPKPQGFWSGLGKQLIGSVAGAGISALTGGVGGMMSSWFKPQTPQMGYGTSAGGWA